MTEIDNNKKKNWDVKDEIITTHDPLLYCLLLLTKYYDTPCSIASLTERLPLVRNCLTPALFIRAAQRAGLAAEVNKLPLSSINDLALPAVLLLKDGDACILIAGRCKRPVRLLCIVLVKRKFRLPIKSLKKNILVM